MKYPSSSFARVATIALALVFGTATAVSADAEKAAVRPPAKPVVNFPLEAGLADRTGKERLTSYADVLAKVTPAVVNVRTSRVRKDFSLDERRRLFYGMPVRGEIKGLGSGTIIHPDGYVLTNHHVANMVANDALFAKTTFVVELADGREFPAKVVGSDPRTDVAVLKIEGKDFPVARLADSSTLRVGDIVFAIGNPLNVGLSVSSGIVSALGRETGILGEREGVESFIQTDAAINQGNSGGPLVNAEGCVIGVNTAIVSTSGGNVGIGFAVPSRLALDVAHSLVNRGTVGRGFLGIEGRNITPRLAEALKLPAPRGVLVSYIAEDGPADKAGLHHEDTIVSINGLGVKNWDTLRGIVSTLKPGEKAAVEIFRAGKKETLSVVVGSRFVNEMEELLGEYFEIKPLDNDIRAKFGIPGGRTGVIVINVPQNSPFHGRLGRGVVISAANNIPVKTSEELAAALKKGETNTLRVHARNVTREIEIDL